MAQEPVSRHLATQNSHTAGTPEGSVGNIIALTPRRDDIPEAMDQLSGSVSHLKVQLPQVPQIRELAQQALIFSQLFSPEVQSVRVAGHFL